MNSNNKPNPDENIPAADVALPPYQRDDRISCNVTWSE
jgi:hypothetical protein